MGQDDPDGVPEFQPVDRDVRSGTHGGADVGLGHGDPGTGLGKIVELIDLFERGRRPSRYPAVPVARSPGER